MPRYVLESKGTCRKLNISVWDYLTDRISRAIKFPFCISSSNNTSPALLEQYAGARPGLLRTYETRYELPDLIRGFNRAVSQSRMVPKRRYPGKVQRNQGDRFVPAFKARSASHSLTEG
jgi:hypothetical protein